MTQDIKHLASLCNTAKKSANELLELDGSGEHTLPSENSSTQVSFLKEQVSAAKDNIVFLQTEHASMLKGLHTEIEKLQELCRNLQFRYEVESCIPPDSDFFKCSSNAFEEKVNSLTRENSELRRKLSESHQAIDILDQKEKLALWHHHQELEQRDQMISALEKELESKCTTIAQLTSSAQGARRKKSNFWRRFSFSSSNNPSTSSSSVFHSKMQSPRVEHLSREDLPSEMQGSLPSYESQYQSYSSYSSLSDKSVSDDEGLGKGEYSKRTVKLPPISSLPMVSNRQLVKQHLRIHGFSNKSSSDSLAIDQIHSPDSSHKRTSKT